MGGSVVGNASASLLQGNAVHRGPWLPRCAADSDSDATHESPVLQGIAASLSTECPRPGPDGKVLHSLGRAAFRHMRRHEKLAAEPGSIQGFAHAS